MRAGALLAAIPPMGTKKDFTQVAFSVFQQAIGEEEKPQPLTGRKANSSKGGKIGGVARAKKLTKEQLAQQAKSAAETRWSVTPPRKSRAKSGKNEGLTEQIVYGFLHDLGYYGKSSSILVEPKKSSKPQIQKLLASASKRIGSSEPGYPDYIIRDSGQEDVAVVIECKADPTKHVSESLDQFADYAVDGARLYADYLSKELDVIYIGVSGETDSELKVSHYVKLKGDKEHKEILKGCRLQPFPDYLEQLRNHRFRVDYSSLLEYVGGLNKQLHGKRIPEKQRAILFSGILLALEDATFRNTYRQHADSSALMDTMITRVSKILNSASSNSAEKFAGLRDEFATIQHSPALIRDGYFKELVQEIEEKVHSFVKNNEYHDIISRCYVEFLKYANDDGSLGIVLTPSHITQLFCDLAGVGKDSIVLDNCCGTAGLLVAAMGKMVAAANGDKKKIEHIKKRQLVGVEYQPHIFNLAVSNMIIHGDGKSNIFHEDCFKSTELVRPFKPNVALLNPPFNDGSGIDELQFVGHALSCLEPNGIAIAIVPMSCAMYDGGAGLEIKRKLLELHTLEASMSLPNQLFNDKGANTCALAFRAHVPHDTKKKTWFGYWREDGFIKSKRRREDSAGRWLAIRETWIDSFRNRTVETGFSLLQSVKAEDEWLCEAYLETDYSTIAQADFERDVKRFALYRIGEDMVRGTSVGFRNFLSSKNRKKSTSHEHARLEDLFEVKYGTNLELNHMTLNPSGINFVARTSQNNGVTAKVQRLYDVEPTEGMALTVAGGGSVLETFLQVEPFYSGRDLYYLRPKVNMTVDEMLYYATCIRANQYKYSYGRQANKTLRDLKIPAFESVPPWVNGILRRVTEQIKRQAANLA